MRVSIAYRIDNNNDERRRLTDQYVKQAIEQIEENQKIPQEYGIMSIPTVKLFKDGKIVDEFIGAKPEDFIKNL